MASACLKIQQADAKRLSQIRDTVKLLYSVSIVLNSADGNDNNSRTSTEHDNLLYKSCDTSLGDNRRKEASQENGAVTCTKSKETPVPLGRVPEALSPSVNLFFHSDTSPENIEKAKNFAKIHLIPSPDYVTSSHQLRNHQEFDMVLECSQKIQTSSSALLTYNRDCDEVTLQGPEKNVVAARSQVVMILDKLREQTSAEISPLTDNEIQQAGYKQFDNSIFTPDLEKQSKRLTSEGSAFARKNTDLCAASNANTKHKCNPPMQSQLQVRGPNTCSQNYCAETSRPSVSAWTAFITTGDSRVHGTHNIAEKEHSSASSFSSSSSDDENASEENILTDPRYNKQIEQALKLGYPETHIKKALAKLGPDCALNDLLSELIKIGAAETEKPGLSSPVQNSAPPAEEALLNQRWSEGTASSEDSVFHSGSRDTDLGSDSPHLAYADVNDSSNLRHIIIDGSNVAMSHGKKIFSCKGIKIAVDYFRRRGHKKITAFVPQWRKETSRPDAPISDQDILSDLEKEGIVVFTPARRVKGRRVVCYDDRYVLKLAVDTDGIVVSNDVYRDLVSEREDFRKVVDQRLLMYSFVSDIFMPPEDPLGRLGPTLDNFLRKTPVEPSPKPQDCPYGKKCTYGNKCRFYHPERGFTPQKSITDTIKEQYDLKLQERATKQLEIAEKGKKPKQKLARTKSLVPGEPFPPSLNSYTSESDYQGKKEKPKLIHSKSLVFPAKTSDYLSESRKKLEEAELSATLEKMSVLKDSSSFQPVSPETSAINQPQESNQRTSPLPQKDIINQSSLPLDQMASCTPPLRTAPSKSPRASPTHLTVPKPEPQEGYLSGHLLIAKRLSDESNENNFFSEHTSSPSSTRTSSPVVSVKTTDQKSQHMVETLPKEVQNELFGGGIALPHQLLHPQLQHQAYESRNVGNSSLENIPNLSIFDQGSIRYHSNMENPPINRHQSVDNSNILSPINMFPYAPDSGHYTGSELMSSPAVGNMSDQMPSPFQSMLEIPPPSSIQPYQSNPVSKMEEMQQPHEHYNLRRAFSSTGNVKNEDEYPAHGRRASGFALPNPRGEHVLLKPQQSMPVHQKTSTVHSGMPLGLTRQNSSSDPQIHNIRGSGEFRDLLPMGMVSRLQEPQTIQNIHHQQEDPRQMLQMSPQQLPQPLHHRQSFDNQRYSRLQQVQQIQQQQQMQLRQQQLHHQDPHLMSPQFMSSPNTGNWAEQMNHSKIIHNPQSRGPALVQSPPQHSHLSHIISSTGDHGIMTGGSLLSSPPPSSQFHHQHIAYPPPTSSPLMPQNLRQPFMSQRSYPQHQTLFQNGPVYGHAEQTNLVQPPPHFQPNQPSPSVHPASMSRILPEDTPITPEDPRYSLYYHLSNVFREQTVRRVMNLNPGVLNPDKLCNLITVYNQETGN